MVVHCDYDIFSIQYNDHILLGIFSTPDNVWDIGYLCITCGLLAAHVSFIILYKIETQYTMYMDKDLGYVT